MRRGGDFYTLLELTLTLKRNVHVLSYFTDLHGKVKVFLAQGGKTFHPAPHIKKSVRQ